MGNDTPRKQVVAEPASNVSYSPSLMACVSLLPIHDYQNKVSSIVRTNGRMTLTVKPGKDDLWAYGKIPRLFILYIQTLITTQSPNVDPQTRTIRIEDNFHAFCRKTGIASRSNSSDTVVQQVLRLAQTSFNLHVDDSDEGRVQERAEMFFFADQVRISFEKYHKAASYIVLSKPMWDLLTKSSIPVDFTLISKLGKSARTIDVYLWLTYRMNSMPQKGIQLTWEQLLSQFDGDGTDIRNFRKKFKESVRVIQGLWPELNVTIDKIGVHVDRCTPSIPPKDSSVTPDGERRPVRRSTGEKKDDVKPATVSTVRPPISEGFISKVYGKAGYSPNHPVEQRKMILSWYRDGLAFEDICERMKTQMCEWGE